MADPALNNFQDYLRRVLIAVGISLAAIILALLLWRFAELLLLVFAAVLFAVCISGPSEILARYTRLPRGVALAIIIAGLLAIVSLGAWTTGSRVVDQVQTLSEKYPLALDRLEANLQSSDWGKWIVTQAEAVRTQLTLSGPLLGSAGGILSKTFGAVGNVFAIVIVGMFVAVSPRLYLDGLIRLLPIPKRPRGRQVLERVGLTLQWWFLGQLLSMVVNSILIWIGLLMLGVPLALTLAILAGLMTFVPNFGPFIAATPAVLLALTTSAPGLNFSLAIYVAVLYVVVNVLDGTLITPTIQRRAVAIPPAMIILAQAVLLIGFGPFGLIFATPMLAAVLVLVKALYVEDMLGDKGPV